jgi:hypothetical protein
VTTALEQLNAPATISQTSALGQLPPNDRTATLNNVTFVQQAPFNPHTPQPPPSLELSTQAITTLGNSARNNIRRGRGLNNWDFSVFKNFDLSKPFSRNRAAKKNRI